MDHPNLHPSATTNRFFRKYAGLTMIAGGMFVAYHMTDETPLSNEWYTRPDLKPKAAMVKEDSMYDPDAYQQLLETNYGKHRNHDYKKNTLYRWLRPGLADFEVKGNKFAGRSPHTNYNKKTGAFPTLQHNYSDHTN